MIERPILCVVEQRGDVEAKSRESFAQLTVPEHVHLLERAGLPRVSPLDRAIDGHEVECDGWRGGQRVVRHAQQVVAHELTVLARQLCGHGNALRERLLREGCQRWVFNLLLRRVFQRLPVQGGDVLAHLLVEATAGLVAQAAAGNELVHPLRHAEVFARAGTQALRHMHENVDAGDVARAERGTFCAAQQLAGERVHLIDGEVGFHHALHGGDHAVYAEAVGHEAGDVLRNDHALAEHHLAEVPRGREHFRRRIRRGDDLEQVQVARWIEEVHAEEVLLEPVGASFREHLHRDAGRIRRDDGGGLHQRFESRIQRLLGRGLLDDGFEDEVAVGKQIERVVEVADGDERRTGGIHECGRARFLHALEAGLGGAVPVTISAGNVEQDDRDASRGGEGGDAAAHGASPDDAEFRDSHSSSRGGQNKIYSWGVRQLSAFSRQSSVHCGPPLRVTGRPKSASQPVTTI